MDDGTPLGVDQPKTKGKRAAAILANRAAYWMSRHWLAILNLLVGLYVSLPFLAPVLMQAGATRQAGWLYKAYSPACHQMAFRSWYLFGEQSYYPLETSGIGGVRYFEEYVLDDPQFANLDSSDQFFEYSWQARSFLGNEVMGYKVALCQRDVAIYMALFGGGLLFGLLRRKPQPLPWQRFVLFGVLPMALDGGYQLLTYMIPQLLPAHETIPLLRTITGALFGFGLVGLTYPQIHIGMNEIAVELGSKLYRAGVIAQPSIGYRQEILPP